MDLQLKINTPETKELTAPDGWFMAKHCSTGYNRVLFVSGDEVSVFSTNYSHLQKYKLEDAQRLYRDWTEINLIKLEVW